MRKYQRFFLLLCVLVITEFCSFADEVEEVTLEVTGEAPIYNNEVVQAQQMALEDAFRKAVMQAMGTWVTAESFTRNFVSIENSVLIKSRGYIKTYELLNLTISDNIVYLTAKITVAVSPLQADLESLLGAVDNPHLVVLAEEPFVKEMVEKGFKSKGFPVILCAHSWPEEITPRMFAEIYEECFAEIVLLVAVDSQYSEVIVQGNKVWGCILTLFANGFWLDSGERFVDGSVHANGAGKTKEAAFKQAVNRAYPVLLEQLVKEIVHAWSDMLLNGRSIEVYVNNIRYENIMDLEKRLRGIFGVRDVLLRKFENSTAMLEVRFTGSSQTLADLIAMTEFGEQNVDITEVKSNEIHLIVNPKP